MGYPWLETPFGLMMRKDRKELRRAVRLAGPVTLRQSGYSAGKCGCSPLVQKKGGEADGAPCAGLGDHYRVYYRGFHDALPRLCLVGKALGSGGGLRNERSSCRYRGFHDTAHQVGRSRAVTRGFTTLPPRARPTTS